MLQNAQKFQADEANVREPARRSNVGWIPALALVAILAAGAAVSSPNDRSPPPFPEIDRGACLWCNSTGDPYNGASPTAYQKSSYLRSRVCGSSRWSDALPLFSSKARVTTARRSAKSSAFIICSKAASVIDPSGPHRGGADQVRRRRQCLVRNLYDRELKDIFAVQSEIAGAVAKQLKVALLGHNGQAAQLATAGAALNQMSKPTTRSYRGIIL